MIKSIQFSSNRNSEILNNVIIAPPSADRGSISVICGKNHSGKTYIVDKLQKCIFKRNEQLEINPDTAIYRNDVDKVYVDYCSNQHQIIKSVFVPRISKITELIQGVSVISKNNHVSSEELRKPEKYSQVQIKNGLELFFYECINYHFDQTSKKILKDEWFGENSFEYRINILNKLDTKFIHSTQRNNPVIKIFEKLTQGRLYFGVNQLNSKERGKIPVFELSLAFTESNNIGIGAWSEGQKVLFSILVLIYYIKPDVLIFDEIENHLHPEYISSLMEFLRENVKQTIITSHHPHIIFSNHVDIVNYLELSKLTEELPDKLLKSNKENIRPLKQKNIILSKNYSKILSAYKLFDAYDNRLLRFSSSSISDLNEVLVDTFTSLFNYEIIAPNSKNKPDLQAQKLYEIFEKRFQEKSLKVLEFGAGEGRLLINIDKILKTFEKNKIEWYLYEPFEEPRIKLQANLAKHNYKSLINICSERPNDKFDFIVIPNVLHELTPNTIANILWYCTNSLTKGGSIIIVELFPLLKPEKYAVPLRSTEWTKLARLLGFRAVSNPINFKNAIHEAYFTQISIPSEMFILNEVQVANQIQDFWEGEILSERMSSYDGHIQFGDVDEIPLNLGNLCTIASITAYRNNVWETT